MTKVLIITHRFYPEVGGIETNSEILATGFCNAGAEVHVITWTKDATHKQFPFAVIRNPDLKKLFREHKWADVILENNPSLRLSWPNIFIKKPLVIALNTWVTRLNGERGFRDRLKYVWFKRAKRMIAVSDAVRKKEWPQAVVITNPYNDSIFHIDEVIKKEIPFVFLGRLVSDKGADQAIRAIKMLVVKEIINATGVRLTIIGEGPEKRKLMQLADKSGIGNIVRFEGALRGNKLAQCLNRHQYILIPSSWEEPYGNVALEGMACGCIPIASDGGGLPEAVGDAGFLFSRNNADEMQQVLEDILQNKSNIDTVKQKAVAHLKDHTMQKVSEKYLDILKQVIN